MYCHQQPVANHVRCDGPGTTTDPAHMPKRHQKHHQWTPGRLKNWARDVGTETLKWVSRELDSRDHPEQVYRLCFGLLNLLRTYPTIRLDAACGLANRHGLRRLKQIESILRSNRDRLPESHAATTALAQDHANIRGPKSFH